MAASFNFNMGNKVTGGEVKRIRWVGDDSHVVFGHKFSSENGNVRSATALLSPKFRLKSSLILTQSDSKFNRGAVYLP
jgi:hypothetical protein